MIHLLAALEAASHLTMWLLIPFITYRVWQNVRFLAQIRSMAPGVALPIPYVSVLVPARNEVQNIADTVASLVRQDYPNFEVIVLDDASTDGTGAKLDSLSIDFPHLRTLHSFEQPPFGWNGKSYACHRLAGRASGEWLLFTDADTLHMPSSITQGIALAQSLEVSLLSAFPYQETRTWGERLLISFIMDFLPMLGLDLRHIWQGNNSQIAANGQYILVDAAKYRSIGGHEAIAHDLVDDFALAKHFKMHGHRIAFVNGANMLSCRMYQGRREVWNGFSKNLMLGLEQSSMRSVSIWLKVLFPWIYVALFLFPFVWLFVGQHAWLAVAEISWLILIRALVAREFKRPFSELFTTPLAALVVMLLGTNAVYRRWRKQDITWKGRPYKI
jgi:chlorobactene glucosyltransferase